MTAVVASTAGQSETENNSIGLPLYAPVSLTIPRSTMVASSRNFRPAKIMVCLATGTPWFAWSRPTCSQTQPQISPAVLLCGPQHAE